MKTANQDQTRFSCGGFQLDGDCKKPNGCQYSFRACKNCKLVKCDGARRPPTRRPTIPSRRPTITSRRPTKTSRRPTKTSRRPTRTSNRPPVKPQSRLPAVRSLIDQKIDKMIVNMGLDGTRNDVKIKVCSQDDVAQQDVCCTSDKLSHLLSSEWVGNKTEIWEAKKFGKACKNKVFRVICLICLLFYIC